MKKQTSPKTVQQWIDTLPKELRREIDNTIPLYNGRLSCAILRMDWGRSDTLYEHEFYFGLYQTLQWAESE